MKICIIGAGSIGGLLGARLAVAGHEVSLVARGEHLAALRANGLTLRESGGVRTYRLRASDRPADFGVQDAVFLTLKAYSIGPMLPQLAPLLSTDTPVVTAINGIPWWYFCRVGGPFEGTRIECLDPDGTMLATLDPKRLVGCVVSASAEVSAPGVVRVAGCREFVLGELDGTLTPRLVRLAAALEEAGLRLRASQRIRDEIWTKLIGNAAYNPVAALTGAPIDEINADARLVEIIRRIMDETIQVARAYGAEINVSAGDRIAAARALGSARPSMLQDIERGRPLEIDAISVAVGEFGRKAGVPTPTIDCIEALLRARVRHRCIPTPQTLLP